MQCLRSHCIHRWSETNHGRIQCLHSSLHPEHVPVLLGHFFRTYHTLHLSERFGQQPIYLPSIPIFALFTLDASYSKSWTVLAACRFFAGFFGGPALVLIEGTFADVWSADVTVSYYSVLTLASFVGTACGPLIGGFVVSLNGGWRWTQWMTLILTVGAYLFATGMPETYPREIQRVRAKRSPTSSMPTHHLEPFPLSRQQPACASFSLGLSLCL